MNEFMTTETEGLPYGTPTAISVLPRLREQVKRGFLGQDVVLDQVLAGMLAAGHVLIEGKPGLGKTYLVLSLARAFGGHFRRIQFTPDLMPSDVTGFTMFDMRTQTFQIKKGPIFTNLLLADEINRAPAKTQAALLEVMQECQVTIDGDTMPLTPPFMTLATQNPIEHEGTYPLPEAQLDRFLMKILIDYPSLHDEQTIITMASGGYDADFDQEAPVCTPEDIVAAQKAAMALEVVPEVVRYALDLVRATREAKSIVLGAGTRGGISLVRVAKAFAALSGRSFVIPDDVKSAALPVLRHRIQLAPEIAIAGQTADDVLREVIESVPAPRR